MTVEWLTESIASSQKTFKRGNVSKHQYDFWGNDDGSDRKAGSAAPAPHIHEEAEGPLSQEAVYVSVLLGAVRKTLPLPRLSLATFDEKPSL